MQAPIPSNTSVVSDDSALPPPPPRRPLSPPPSTPLIEDYPVSNVSEVSNAISSEERPSEDPTPFATPTPSWASEGSDEETPPEVQTSIPSDTSVLRGHSEIQKYVTHSELQLSPRATLEMIKDHSKVAHALEHAEKSNRRWLENARLLYRPSNTSSVYY